jgi:hypothetical protein
LKEIEKEIKQNYPNVFVKMADSFYENKFYKSMGYMKTNDEYITHIKQL